MEKQDPRTLNPRGMRFDSLPRGFWIFRKPRRVAPRGMILPLVLIFLCVMGVLVFSFNQWASHSQRLAFRSGQEEIGRRLLESAVDEAVYLLTQETANPTSPSAQWLIDGANTAPLAWDLARLPQTKAIVEEVNLDGVTKTSSLAVQISKRGEDFRGFRNSGGGMKTYFGREGHGTVVFRGTIKIARGGQPFTGLTLEKFHDYKIICLVSGRLSPGRGNAANRNLDYLLYVKDGLNEFRETQGKMLNNGSLKLECNPAGRGKIYFGGTDDSSNYIFINIGADQSDLLPAADGEKVLEKGDTDKIAQNLDSDSDIHESSDEYRIAGESDVEKGESAGEFLQNILVSLGISLKTNPVPFNTAPTDKEKYAREALFGDTASPKNPDDNIEPGVKLIGKTDQAHQVIEGNVRQRFIYLVEGDKLTKFFDMVKKVNAGFTAPPFFISLTAEAYKKRAANKGEEANKVMVLLHEAIEKIIPNPLRSTVTKVDDELPYGAKLDSERGKIYSTAGVASDYAPFSYFNLRMFAPATQEALGNLGVLTNNTLTLNGAVHVQGPITLGDGVPIKVQGRGVLSTNDDITIKSAVSCNPDAVLVLVTKGNIIIDTSDKIEAGLVAKSIVVRPGKAFHLLGSLFVTRLGSSAWPSGPHVLEYDASRFARDNEDVYAVAVSPRLSFVRMTGGEL